jgi:hypothetical protein
MFEQHIWGFAFFENGFAESQQNLLVLLENLVIIQPLLGNNASAARPIPDSGIALQPRLLVSVNAYVSSARLMAMLIWP